MIQRLTIALCGVTLIAANAPQMIDNAPSAVQERWLAAHNVERQRLDQSALVWDNALARDADIWAKKLAAMRSFEHDTQKKQGENLWQGSKGEYSPEDMVALWIEERALFKNGKFPDVSTSGKWEDVGHYTQLIWHGTTHVGCALAANDEDDVLVCRYSPPGNWVGDFSLKAKSVPKNSVPEVILRSK